MIPKDQQYRPKTTIIPANPGFTFKGATVVAWVIEEGAVTKPITVSDFDGVVFNTFADLPERGADE